MSDICSICVREGCTRGEYGGGWVKRMSEGTLERMCQDCVSEKVCQRVRQEALSKCYDIG